jgi:Est1 DNA/RNA binding domain
VFVFFLRFNINTFFTLLQILLREVEQVVAEDDQLGGIIPRKDTPDKISPTVRRILPCLRQYSSWLVSCASNLVALENHEFVGVQVTEFWRIYADALTLLAATFHKADMPDVDYLLEEDEDTIAFTPFTNANTSRRYVQTDGLTPRPRSRDQGIQRHHPSVEMLYRVRGLLEDGISLATKQV